MQELSPAIAAMLAKSTVDTVESMESGGGGVPRISLKKSKFTAKNGDDEIKLGEEIDVVILGITPPHGFSKTYYAGAYKPGSTDAPDCTSTDGIHPDNQISDPQSDVCRTCEQSQWGSAVSMSGGKAKACADSKRLYVKLAEELTDPKAPIYLVTVTVMSLKPFGAYGKLLANNGIPTPAIAITKLGFDEEASVPKLTFELVGVMDDANVKESLALAEDKSWDQKIVAPKTAMPSAAEKPAIEGTTTQVDDNDSGANIDDAVSNW